MSVVKPALTMTTIVTTTSQGNSQPTGVPVLVVAVGIEIVMFGLPTAESTLPGLELFKIGSEGEPEKKDLLRPSHLIRQIPYPFQ